MKSLERSSCGRQAGPGKVQLSAAAVSRRIGTRARYQYGSEPELRVEQNCTDSDRLSRRIPLEQQYREVKGGKLPVPGGIGRQDRPKFVFDDLCLFPEQERAPALISRFAHPSFSSVVRRLSPIRIMQLT